MNSLLVASTVLSQVSSQLICQSAVLDHVAEPGRLLQETVSIRLSPLRRNPSGLGTAPTAHIALPGSIVQMLCVAHMAGARQPYAYL